MKAQGDQRRHDRRATRTWRLATTGFVVVARTGQLAVISGRLFLPGTNRKESMNARLRKVTRNRGQFPSEQAALKVLYLAVRNLEEYYTKDRALPIATV